MRVIVCGGRDFTDGARVDDELNRIHAETPITFLMEGGARGADHLASLWAALNCVPHKRLRAQWGTYGPAAGPIRNQKMLKEGKPDLVIAFPGGKGTADMVKKAKAAGVKVIEIN